MKICIWFQHKGLAGGSHSFLKTLGRELERLGHLVIHHPSSSCDIVLVNSFSLGAAGYLKPSYLYELRMTGNSTFLGHWWPFKFKWRTRKCPALVHRVDGVVQLYGRDDPKADRYQFENNRLTDFTIFQSLFCKKSFTEYDVRPQAWQVIYNGVNQEIFYPRNDTQGVDRFRLRILAVSWSSNIMKGFDILSCLSELPGVEVRFVGNWCPSVPKRKVVHLGVLPPQGVAQVMRESDVFVHAAHNDPCPNVVVEALSCGLPILYRPSGGTLELAGEYGVSIGNDLSKCVEQIRQRYSELRAKILGSLNRFSITTCAESYIVAFEEALALRRLHASSL